MTSTIARIHPDGSLVRVNPDGSEARLAERPAREMSATEIEATAAGDLDNPPLSSADFQRMPRTPQAKLIRRALHLTQEAFAARFHIPLGTLRDWEQGRSEPDRPARAYLTVIARDPEGVERALRVTGR
jgi:putative transcriptional regulator